MAAKVPLELLVDDDTPLSALAELVKQEMEENHAATPVVADSDPRPPEDLDGQLRPAGDQDQRTVYMWTWSHTQDPARPAHAIHISD
jgi:hypothetical protein